MKIDRGVWAALGAAVLFGLSTPLAKFLLADISPLLLAGLLYTGSGLGLALLLAIRALTVGRASIRRLLSSIHAFPGGVASLASVALQLNGTMPDARGATHKFHVRLLVSR